MKKTWISIGLVLVFLVGGGTWYYVAEREAKKSKPIVYQKHITEKNYDVIVVGGEPEGVSAAVSAARNGMRVLLLEKRNALGGLMTFGMLNYLDIPQNEQGKVVSAGLFKEWRDMVGGDNVNTVDIDEAKQAFLQLVQQEPNITLSLTTEVVKPIMNGKKVTGVIVKDEKGMHTYTGKRIIDATIDGDVAVMAGASYFVGQEDIGKRDKMAATLMIHLHHVDWNKVKQAAKEGVFGGGGATDTAAWGFHEVLTAYEETEPNTNVRGLNIGRTKNGDVYINALQLFDVDGLNEESKKTALNVGEKEAKSFVTWLNNSFPGFENATIASVPDELYIRETRHISSLYQLPVHDLWENRHHWDDIAIGGYPSDIQATNKANTGTIVVDPNQYGIPFRSLVPKEVDHLLVASKASGYSSLAAGSARIIPTGMNVAEAAGVASAYSIKHEESFQKIARNKSSIHAIQRTLKKQEAYLKPLKEKTYPYKGENYYPALRFLYSYDLISGGYQNDFQVEEPMNAVTFVHMLKRGMERSNPLLYQKHKQQLEKWGIETASEPLTQEQAFHLLRELGDSPIVEEGNDKIVKRKEGFMLLYDYLKTTNN